MAVCVYRSPPEEVGAYINMCVCSNDCFLPRCLSQHTCIACVIVLLGESLHHTHTHTCTQLRLEAFLRLLVIYLPGRALSCIQQAAKLGGPFGRQRSRKSQGRNRAGTNHGFWEVWPCGGQHQTEAWAENPSWFGFQNNQRKKTLLSGFSCGV